MATRNRIIYQSVALFSSDITGTAGTGTIASSDVSELQRVTDISWGGEVTRQDINVMGQLANISREIIEEPVVNLEFSYFLANGYNESTAMGMTVYTGTNGATEFTGNAISNILAEEDGSAERNYYVLVVGEGVDADGTAPDVAHAVIGIGNAFMTSYSINLAVGEIPNASASFECANLTFSNPDGSDQVPNPAIDRTGTLPDIQYDGVVTMPTYNTIAPEDSNSDLTVSVLRPGDITLDFETGAGGNLSAGGAILPGTAAASSKQSAHVQSVSIEIPMSRTPISRLGNQFAFSRPLDVPINTTLTVSANMGDITTGSLVNLICNDDESRSIRITLNEKCNDGANMILDFRGCQLDSQSMSQGVGDNQTVDLTFTAQIGGANDQTNGLFISGQS